MLARAFQQQYKLVSKRSFSTFSRVFAEKTPTTTTQTQAPAQDQYQEYDFPKAEWQTLNTVYVQSTGIEREELEMGTEARFPEEYIHYRTEEEWGTFEKPILVPTAEGERIVECMGLCVEDVTHGEGRMWVMKPKEWAICDECGQVFYCYDENEARGNIENALLGDPKAYSQIATFVEDFRKQYETNKSAGKSDAEIKEANKKFVEKFYAAENELKKQQLAEREKQQAAEQMALPNTAPHAEWVKQQEAHGHH